MFEGTRWHRYQNQSYPGWLSNLWFWRHRKLHIQIGHYVFSCRRPTLLLFSNFSETYLTNVDISTRSSDIICLRRSCLDLSKPPSSFKAFRTDVISPARSSLDWPVNVLSSLDSNWRALGVDKARIRHRDFVVVVMGGSYD